MRDVKAPNKRLRKTGPSAKGAVQISGPHDGLFALCQKQIEWEAVALGYSESNESAFYAYAGHFFHLTQPQSLPEEP
jgi:hypothetical protein